MKPMECVVLFIAGVVAGIIFSLIWMDDKARIQCESRGGVYVMDKCLKVEVIK